MWNSSIFQAATHLTGATAAQSEVCRPFLTCVLGHSKSFVVVQVVNNLRHLTPCARSPQQGGRSASYFWLAHGKVNTEQELSDITSENTFEIQYFSNTNSEFNLFSNNVESRVYCLKPQMEELCVSDSVNELSRPCCWIAPSAVQQVCFLCWSLVS